MFFGRFSVSSMKTNLDDGGKILSTDVVLCFQIQVTQLTGSHGIVLGIELIETLEGLSTLQRNIKDTRDLDQERMNEEIDNGVFSFRNCYSNFDPKDPVQVLTLI